MQPSPPYPQPPATSAMVVGRETAYDSGGSSGPCPSPFARHTVFLIRVRARGRQWVVRRRYRQFLALHQQVQEAELRAVFPPRSLCAQGGLACALETRQVRLAYYVNELVNTKLPDLPPRAQGAVLRFLEGGYAGAQGEGEEEEEEEEEEVDGDGVGMRKSLTALADEEKNVAGAGGAGVIEVAGRKARLSPRAGAGKGQGGGEGEAPWAGLDAEARAAYERLRSVLANGVTVVKHGRRGGPKQRLIFCNEDATTLYWASSSAASSSSPRRRRQQNQQQGLSSLPLAEVSEVRAFCDPDPAHPGQTGTATLRRRRSSILSVVVSSSSSEEAEQRRLAGIAARGLSLITPARSLDLEALSPGDCRLLLDGFRAAVAIARVKRARAREAAMAATSPRGAAGVGKALEGQADGRSPRRVAPAFGL